MLGSVSWSVLLSLSKSESGFDLRVSVSRVLFSVRVRATGRYRVSGG